MEGERIGGGSYPLSFYLKGGNTIYAFLLKVDWDDKIEEYPLLAKTPLDLAVAMSPILDKLGDENLFRTKVVNLGKAKKSDYKRRVNVIVKH